MILKNLLDILQAFTNTGNTVVVIEHNLDVIKTADHIIDMGPEGGVDGGKIIAEGTPEKVSNEKDSYTGQFLKEILRNKGQMKKLHNNDFCGIINYGFNSTIFIENSSSILAYSSFSFLGLYFASGGFDLDQYFFSWLFRYLHVLAGIMWIGLLWYLNFVQIPSMPKLTDEQKPAITKIIAPAVLFWFRWAAFATILTGLLVAYLNNYLHESMTLGIGSGGGKNTAIGIGMWLGIIMAYNVWFIIWPNQKKHLV